MRSRDADMVIIPGIGGSGPDHWQSRWQAKLPTAVRVEQVDWDRPQFEGWIQRVIETVASRERPVVVVAHSLGVLSLAHAVSQGLAPLAGAFLVAPPEARALREIEAIDPAFVPVPEVPLPFPSMLIASRSDPYATFEASARLAEAWSSTLLDAGDAGHINPESGHGPWPEGLMAFGGFLSKL